MIRVERLLGFVDDPAYAGRRCDVVSIDWSDATRRRLRRTSVAGVDVAIDVPRGTFLADGAVLVDDGETIIAVERPATPALVVRIDPTLDTAGRVRAAALIGHAFGNQHAPLDVVGDEIRVPLTTSADIALATVEGLGLTGASAEIAEVSLAQHAALSGSDSGHHGHAHSHHEPSPGGHHHEH